MKRYLSLFCVLALVFLTACAAKPEEEPKAGGPVALPALSVEIQRGGASSQILAQAVRELPEALKTALAAQEVEVEAVTVTVGSSPAATAQAVEEGGVDLALLPEADFDLLEDAPQRVLTSGSMLVLANREDETLTGETFAAALALALEEVQATELGEAVFGGDLYTVY